MPGEALGSWLALARDEKKEWRICQFFSYSARQKILRNARTYYVAHFLFFKEKAKVRCRQTQWAPSVQGLHINSDPEKSQRKALDALLLLAKANYSWTMPGLVSLLIEGLLFKKSSFSIALGIVDRCSGSTIPLPVPVPPPPLRPYLAKPHKGYYYTITERYPWKIVHNACRERVGHPHTYAKHRRFW